MNVDEWNRVLAVLSDLIAWATDEGSVMGHDGTTPFCLFCEERDYGDGNGVEHASYCLHQRLVEADAPEPTNPLRAKVVARGDEEGV